MGLLVVCKGADFSKCAVDKVDLPAIPDCEHKYDNDCDTACNLCGETRTAPHNFVDGFCADCGKRSPDNPYTIAEYPVTETLKGLYDFGYNDETASLVNHAPNSTAVPNVVVNGSWEVADKYATFSDKTNASRIDTNVLLPLEDGVTLVALFSVPTGGRPLIGNRRGNFGLDLRNTGLHICVDGVAEHENHIFPDPICSNNFAIVAMTADTNGYRVVRYTNGALATLKEYEGKVDAWSTASSMVSANGFKIGGNSESNNADTAHISLAAIHEGAMTDEQLTEICAFVREYGKQKGLIVE